MEVKKENEKHVNKMGWKDMFSMIVIVKTLMAP